jgi:hypothetical protein
MRRHINLYIQEQPGLPRSVLRALLSLAIIAVLMAGYSEYMRRGVARLQEAALQGEKQLATEKASLAALKQQLALRQDPAAIIAEIDKLKPRASESQEIVTRLKTSELGSIEGYGVHLAALATVSEDGVWLTGIKINNAGKSISLEGRSLRTDAVLKYVHRLNEQFAKHGMQFTGLELSPLAEAERSAGSAVSFKLF